MSHLEETENYSNKAPLHQKFTKYQTKISQHFSTHVSTMRITTGAWACLSVVWPATAQTPNGFAIHSQLPLMITLNPSGGVVTPGLLVPMSDTVIPPTLYAPTSSAKDTTTRYIAMMIDEAVPLLHWLQQDLVQTSSVNNTLQPAMNAQNRGIITPYVRPQPLRGQGPHGYVVFLFSQPSNWTIPSSFGDIVDPKSLTGVVSFNVSDFVQASGLSGQLAGATWLKEENTTSPSSTASSTSSPTTANATTTPAVYTGSAHKMKGGVSWAVVTGALAVLALLI